MFSDTPSRFICLHNSLLCLWIHHQGRCISSSSLSILVQSFGNFVHIARQSLMFLDTPSRVLYLNFFFCFFLVALCILHNNLLGIWIHHQGHYISLSTCLFFCGVLLTLCILCGNLLCFLIHHCNYVFLFLCGALVVLWIFHDDSTFIGTTMGKIFSFCFSYLVFVLCFFSCLVKLFFTTILGNGWQKVITHTICDRAII